MNDIQDQIDAEANFISKLMLKYPDLFPKDESGKTVPPRCGSSCPPGWESLVDELCSCIDYRVKNCENLKQKCKFIYSAYNFIYHRGIHQARHALLKWIDPATPYWDKITTKPKFMGVSTINAIAERHPRRRAIHVWLRSKLTRLYPRYKYHRAPIPSVCIDQIKEKFGTLRFYYSGGDDTITGMVHLAESLSGKTCEITGSPGSLHKKGKGYGWYKTLSETQANEIEYTKVE